jgi:hypothetical protein
MKSSLRSIREEHWRRNFGVTVGCRVRTKGKRNVLQVVAFQHHSFDDDDCQPWLTCRILKKNGEPSKAEQTVFGEDWTFMEP